MRAQKRVSYILAVPLFIIATIATQLSGIGIGTASAATLAWDGSAGDGLFSNGQNWNTGNAPVNGDVLAFNLSGVSTSPTYTNDISNLSVAGITLSGAATGYLFPELVGNTLTVTGNISNTVAYNGYGAAAKINTGIVLGANVTVTGPVEFGGNGKTTNVGAYTLSLTNPAESCAQAAGSLVGTGAVTFSGTPTTQYVLNTASPSFSGAVNVTSGYVYVSAQSSLGNASGLMVSGSGRVSLFATGNSTWTTPLTLGGTGSLDAQHASITGCSGSSPTQKYTATITGPVTLTSDFLYSGSDHLKITGTYTNNGHNFTVKNGSTGTLTTGNSTLTAPVVSTELAGDQPNTNTTVSYNETAVLSGTRGTVSVSEGGIFKGTGTVQNLSLFNGGVVAPGNSPGTLTVTETYNQTDSTYNAEILNTSSYDKLVVGAGYTGSGNAVTLGSGAVLTPILYSGWKITAGDKFTIIDNVSTTAVSGTFAGLAEGAQLTVDGITFTISYVGGNGNDVVLTALNSGVGAPNTGVQKLIMGNPIAVAGLGIIAAAAIAFVTLRRKSNR